MNIGDKVRVTKGEYKGLVGTVGNIMGEKVRIDNSRVDVFLWYNESDLEPVIEHKFKIGDKVIVNGHNAEITYVTYADNNPYRVRYDNGVMGWYDESELEPISDHMTADELAEEELDEIKAAEFERGYRYGINSVITNIQRFLKEIAP